METPSSTEGYETEDYYFIATESGKSTEVPTSTITVNRVTRTRSRSSSSASESSSSSSRTKSDGQEPTEFYEEEPENPIGGTNTRVVDNPQAKTGSTSNSQTVAYAAGSLIPIALIACVAALVLVRSRSKQVTDFFAKWDNADMFTGHNPLYADKSGMKENPLFESSSEAFGSKREGLDV